MSITIAQATIRELDEAAVLFDEYRVFYGQESDVEGAKAFLFGAWGIRYFSGQG